MPLGRPRDSGEMGRYPQWNYQSWSCPPAGWDLAGCSWDLLQLIRTKGQFLTKMIWGPTEHWIEEIPAASVPVKNVRKTLTFRPCDHRQQWGMFIAGVGKKVCPASAPQRRTFPFTFFSGPRERKIENTIPWCVKITWNLNVNVHKEGLLACNHTYSFTFVSGCFLLLWQS